MTDMSSRGSVTVSTRRASQSRGRRLSNASSKPHTVPITNSLNSIKNLQRDPDAIKPASKRSLQKHKRKASQSKSYDNNQRSKDVGSERSFASLRNEDNSRDDDQDNSAVRASVSVGDNLQQSGNLLQANDLESGVPERCADDATRDSATARLPSAASLTQPGRENLMSAISADLQSGSSYMDKWLCNTGEASEAFGQRSSVQYDYGSAAGYDDDVRDDGDEYDNETALILTEAGDKPYDHVAVMQQSYEEECERLNQVPSKAFLKVCGQTCIRMKNISLGPRGIQAMCPPIMIASEATSLDLSGTDMRDEGMEHLAKTLKENQLIMSLDVGSNSLGPASARTMEKVTQRNPSITTIDLSGNLIGDAGAAFVADMIENSTSVGRLNISNNRLGNRAARQIASALCKNGSLTHLSLGWNRIQPDGAKRLILGVRDNVRLEKLDLSHNGVGEQTGGAIARLLLDNDILKELHLSNTRLADVAVKAVARGLASNETLQVLDLSGNAFCGEAACAILLALMRNPNTGLRHLNLSGLVVTERFRTLLRELAEHVPSLLVQYDTIESRRSYKDYIRILFTHWDDRNLRYGDVFDEADTTPTQDFIAQLQKHDVPLNLEDLDHFASMLDTTDTGMPLIRHLKVKWEDWEARNQILVNAAVEKQTV